MEQLYKDHKHIIEAISKKFVSCYGNQGTLLEDLMSEGNLTFVECVLKFDSDKGNFNTYLASALYKDLLLYKRKELKENHFMCDNFVEIVNSAHEFLDEDPLYFITNGISNDAEIIIEATLKIFPQKGRKRTVLYNYLRKTFGWRQRRILSGFNEIEGILAN